MSDEWAGAGWPQARYMGMAASGRRCDSRGAGVTVGQPAGFCICAPEPRLHNRSEVVSCSNRNPELTANS
eukprot:scaffold31976_cov48-Phaeocystis_antarctica.AAC.3